MELGLSLGDHRASSKPSFGFMEKSRDITNKGNLGFCMALSVGNPINKRKQDQEDEDQEDKDRNNYEEQDEEEEEDDDDDDYDTEDDQAKEKNINNKRIKKSPPLIQLDLLPNTPVPRYQSGLDVNRVPVVGDHEDQAAVSCSPPNSATSSFQMDFGTYSKNGTNQQRASSSRASDEDENGCTRKKLRLSKQQSAFLEDTFKDHNTLNPKQKIALAKQLNLSPRQVEVWFQNRRARTKLKQTEVDCEYLKRCCETLTEENRRLNKEVQELRSLKSSNPFYMQLPATTLTMCPSCERVATTTTSTTTAAPPPPPPSSKATDLSLSSMPK